VRWGGRVEGRVSPLHARRAMNRQDRSVDWATQKFGIGQPVPRTEDPKLVRGEGSYTDDVRLPGQAYAAMVRSRHAHGVIRNIDVSAARNMPGVLGVFTGQDLAAAGYGTLQCIVPFKNRDGSEMRKRRGRAWRTDRVGLGAAPSALGGAETAARAREAAEAVEVEIEPLPAVTRAREAAKSGAPALYAEAPDNVALDYHYGDAD